MSRLAHLRDALTYGLARPCAVCRAAEAIEGDTLCGDCHAELCAEPPALSPRLVAHWSHAPTVMLLRRAAAHRGVILAAAAAVALAVCAGDDVRAWCDEHRDAAWEAQDAGMRGEVGCAAGVAS